MSRTTSLKMRARMHCSKFRKAFATCVCTAIFKVPSNCKQERNGNVYSIICLATDNPARILLVWKRHRKSLKVLPAAETRIFCWSLC